MKPEDRRYKSETKFFKYFEAMKEVYSEVESVVLTQEEAHYLINDKLAPEDRVGYSTAEMWRGHGTKRIENVDQVPPEVAQEFRDFLGTIKAKQKMILTRQSLDNENKGAYKQHWLLERKFEDLRLNQNAIQLNPTIRIEAGDQEGKKLIDQIINGETIDVDHDEV